MMDKFKNKPVFMEINLNNLEHNFLQVRRLVGDKIKIMGIVKANSYGLGAVNCAKLFERNGVDYLGVSTLSEGIELREANINTKVLLLNYTPKYNFDKLLKYDLIQTIYNYEDAKHLSDLAKEMGKRASIHIKIDTGMTRLGFLPNKDSFEEIFKISQLPNLNIDGIFSHFAKADEVDKSFSQEQYKKFIWSVKELEHMGIDTGIKHISSSAAIMDLPEYNLDMVRPGIILYGHYPSQEVNKEKIILKPTLTLKATISNIKQVPIGVGISYNHIFTTKRQSTIATLPIGYADGFSRRLNHRARVFVKDKTVPIVGKICMDQMMIDITDSLNVEIGDKVVLIGYENEKYPSVEELASHLDTINYEVLCSIGRRIPRVYTYNGEVVQVVDYLID